MGIWLLRRHWGGRWVLRRRAVRGKVCGIRDRVMLRSNLSSITPQLLPPLCYGHLFGDGVDVSGRRSSAYTNGRPSSIGFLSQVPPQIAKDPRPIRDKTYMANAQRNIIDYLISANYPIPISIKTLQVPTSKDFAKIFKFLYNRMDPNYQFVKKIEDEVVLCLKALK